MEDEEIVSLYIKRDETAVEETTKKYGSLCRSIAYDVTRDKQDAEECVNDALLSAWRSIPPEHPESLGAYMAKLTRNRAINVVRSETAKKRGGEYETVLGELDDALPDLSTDIADEVAVKNSIRRFLADLDPKTRMVFMRRYWYMRSTKDIARDFGMTDVSVRVALHRAKKKLKARLETDGINI